MFAGTDATALPDDAAAKRTVTSGCVAGSRTATRMPAAPSDATSMRATRAPSESGVHVSDARSTRRLSAAMSRPKPMNWRRAGRCQRRGAVAVERVELGALVAALAARARRGALPRLRGACAARRRTLAPVAR